MESMMTGIWMYVFCILGFLFLIKGADLFVDGTSSIAKLLKIPSLIIGLTIVAFGTSAPELSVSITSAIKGQNGIALGNVVGSNIFNVLVVAGVAALLTPLRVQSNLIKKDLPFNLLASVALIVLSFDVFLNKTSDNVLSRSDGIILLLLFCVFMYYLITYAINSRDEEEAIKTLPVWKSILFTVIGLAGIIIGGDLVVDSASAIAISWGMSEAMVGLTIVAIGTSLPELVTSIVAGRKGECDIALGNVVGSNIFNILLILGVSSTINPIEITDPFFITDILVMLVVCVMAFFFALNKKISRLEGLIMVLSYVGYMTYIIIR